MNNLVKIESVDFMISDKYHVGIYSYLDEYPIYKLYRIDETLTIRDFIKHLNNVYGYNRTLKVDIFNPTIDGNHEKAERFIIKTDIRG